MRMPAGSLTSSYRVPDKTRFWPAFRNLYLAELCKSRFRFTCLFLRPHGGLVSVTWDSSCHTASVPDCEHLKSSAASAISSVRMLTFSLPWTLSRDLKSLGQVRLGAINLKPSFSAADRPACLFRSDGLWQGWYEAAACGGVTT
jgi:hypothetical protein